MTLPNTEERQLAAAVILQAFDDLAAPEHTASVYAAFFYSDYCKSLFDLAGVVYDKKKIVQRIAERPKRTNQDTKKCMYGRFTFDVVDGYIAEITDDRGNLYHFESVGREKDKVSYYYISARSQLARGRYCIVEGV